MYRLSKCNIKCKIPGSKGKLEHYTTKRATSTRLDITRSFRTRISHVFPNRQRQAVSKRRETKNPIQESRNWGNELSLPITNKYGIQSTEYKYQNQRYKQST